MVEDLKTFEIKKYFRERLNIYNVFEHLDKLSGFQTMLRRVFVCYLHYSTHISIFLLVQYLNL